ncbi:hypothetical protein BaRGS_00007247, partial [Batillaria attramentaria]
LAHFTFALSVHCSKDAYTHTREKKQQPQMLKIVVFIVTSGVTTSAHSAEPPAATEQMVPVFVNGILAKIGSQEDEA